MDKVPEKAVVIKDVQMYIDFLRSIVKFIPHCELRFRSDRCYIRGTAQSQKYIALIETNCATSAEDVDFSLKELAAFVKSVEAVHEFDKVDENLIMKISPSFIEYQGTSKFKIRSSKEDAVQGYSCKDAVKVPENDFGFSLDSTNIKKLLSLSSIATSSNPLLYFYKEGNNIIGEIGDKSERLSNSIGIPISEDHYGMWTTTFSVSLESLRIFNLINADKININMTKQKVLVIDSKVNTDKYYLRSDVVMLCAKR